MPIPPLRSGLRFRDVHFRYARPARARRRRLRGEGRHRDGDRRADRLGQDHADVAPPPPLRARRGAIEIDGVDIRRFEVASLRARVGMALQENMLFGTTIRENVRYAVPDATTPPCARRCGSPRPTSSSAPGAGLDTPLGERGTKLSTGQRQRLSIARAVLKDTPILVLDEPTASLDAETELRVLQNLAAWGRGPADPPDHAPPLHDPPRRPDPRAPRGARRRGGQPRRADGARRRRLPPPRRARAARAASRARRRRGGRA